MIRPLSKRVSGQYDSKVLPSDTILMLLNQANKKKQFKVSCLFYHCATILCFPDSSYQLSFIFKFPKLIKTDTTELKRAREDVTDMFYTDANSI